MRGATLHRLEGARRNAILASFILGACVAPVPDAWHQILMGARPLLIYEGIILLARLVDRPGGA